MNFFFGLRSKVLPTSDSISLKFMTISDGNVSLKCHRHLLRSFTSLAVRVSSSTTLSVEIFGFPFLVEHSTSKHSSRANRKFSFMDFSFTNKQSRSVLRGERSKRKFFPQTTLKLNIIEKVHLRIAVIIEMEARSVE